MQQIFVTWNKIYSNIYLDRDESIVDVGQWK